MGKRKRKRRSTGGGTPSQGPDTGRQERKEQARREREARNKRARRRQMLRRLSRFAVVLLVIGLVVGFFVYRGIQSGRVVAEAAEAAERVGCSEVREMPDEGRDHLQPGQPPAEYASRPATSGTHSAQTLDREISVYDQPIDATLEPLAVHSMEHGYVFMYYRAEGNDSLPQDVVDALAGLAESEVKVILAPYPELSAGTSLAFATWLRLQECPRVEDTDDVLMVAEGFIRQFRGDAGVAPEGHLPP